MSYLDIDFRERRHRQALVERKLALHSMYGELDFALDATLLDLSAKSDRRLRVRHSAFLDTATADNVSWLSPGFERIASDALIAETLDNIRLGRRSAHVTDRMGTVATSAGEVYWAIRKPTNIRELFRAAWTHAPFSLELWHPSDIKPEAWAVASTGLS